MSSANVVKVSRKEDEKMYQGSELRKLIPEGSTVYGVLRHRAASNMMAEYSLVVFVDGYDLHPNYGAALLTGRPLVERNGYSAIRVRGCGYDRLQAIVDDLSQALYGKPGALKSRLL